MSTTIGVLGLAALVVMAILWLWLYTPEDVGMNLAMKDAPFDPDDDV